MAARDPKKRPITIQNHQGEHDDDDMRYDNIAPAVTGANERMKSVPIVMIRAAASLCTTLNVFPVATPIEEK